MSDLDVAQFLRLQAEDPYITCDTETCGQCARQKMQSEVAKRMLREEPSPGPDHLKAWVDESERLFQKSKFYQLWQTEKKAGRDPKVAFEALGWQP